MDSRGRTHVFLTALVQVFGLSPFSARLRDVSSGGCKIVTGTPLRRNEIVLITLPVVGELVAFVVWAKAGFCGLRFERPIDADFLLGRHHRAYRHAPVAPVPLTQWKAAARARH